MRGLFSLIQYCPDRGRMESANVGVALIEMPYKAYVRMSPTNEVPRHRGFDFDDFFLTSAKNALAHRLMSEASEWGKLEELEAFRRKEGNSLILTPAKPVLFEDPEVEVAKLYQKFVALPLSVKPSWDQSYASSLL